jgi:GT2 family glycosyltransferase
MPKVLIIIVTWNKRDDVLRLLTSLKEMAYPSSAYDLLVVDNASDDGSAAAVASTFPGIQLVRNMENLGGSGGFNIGLQWAFDQPDGTYDYLWLLDNDVVVHRRALAELVAVLETHDSIGVVGSTMMQLEKPWIINEMGGFLNRVNGRFRLNMAGREIQTFKTKNLETLVTTDGLACSELAPADGVVEVDYVAAASLLVRSENAKHNGLFRDYFIHFDDVEWCLRMARRGARTVASASSLIWHQSSSSRKIPEQVYYYNNRNLLDLLQDYGESDTLLFRLKRWIWIKAFFFALSGRLMTSYYHRKAIYDFEHQVSGKCIDHQPELRSLLGFRWPRLHDL